MTPDRDAMVDAVLALRSAGAVTVDRNRWRAWLAEHTIDGELDPVGKAGYLLFAALSGEELERYYQRHPEVRERRLAHARELAARLGLEASDG